MTEPKPVENCPVCGRLMNRTHDWLRRVVMLCKGERSPYPHTTKVWILRRR